MTNAKLERIYYGMKVYSISDGQTTTELPPMTEPDIDGITALLADETWTSTEEERAIVETHLLQLTKEEVEAEIDIYDSSEAVNSFVLDGMSVWLPYELRSKLSDRLPAEESAGRTDTTLWLGTVAFTMPDSPGATVADRH